MRGFAISFEKPVRFIGKFSFEFGENRVQRRPKTVDELLNLTVIRALFCGPALLVRTRVFQQVGDGLVHPAKTTQRARHGLLGDNQGHYFEADSKRHVAGHRCF